MTDQNPITAERPYYDTPEDRASWAAYNAAGAGLPDYDAAGAHLQRMWHHMERLTGRDISDACRRVVEMNAL